MLCRAARSALLLLPSIVAIVAPARAADDAPSDTGVALSVHVGYALLAGHFLGDSSLDPMRGGTLVGGSAGWRFTRSLEVSAWGEYAAGVVKMNVPECDGTTGCTANDAQIGAEVAWRFLRSPATPRVDPWVGAGFGYEWAMLQYPALTATDPALASVAHPAGSYLVTAPVFARLEVGAEVALDSGFAVGPWLAASLARTSHADTGDASDPPVHAWIALGVRGAFAP